MSNNQGNNPPSGLQQPQISSYTPGAGNPRDSAMIAGQNMNSKQANLINSVGGRKKRSFRGGDSKPSTIIIPQMKLQYTPQNGDSDPNTQIKGLSSTGMQSSANKVYDNQSTQMGGLRKRTRKSRKGGNADWAWGCYSGGRRRTKHHKSRKHRKRTKKHH